MADNFYSAPKETNIRIRTLSFLAASALVVLGATACGPAPTGPSGGSTVIPPAAVTPTPAAPLAPIPAFIYINAHRVGVASTTQASIVEIPFTTDLGTAAAALTAATGMAPTVTPVPATDCVPVASSIYDWGGLTFRAAPPGGGLPPASSMIPGFVAIATSRRTTGGLELAGAGAGQYVGATLDGLLGSATDMPHQPQGDSGATVALGDPQDGGNWGVVFTATGGVVTSFGSPINYRPHGFC